MKKRVAKLVAERVAKKTLEATYVPVPQPQGSSNYLPDTHIARLTPTMTNEVVGGSGGYSTSSLRAPTSSVSTHTDTHTSFLALAAGEVKAASSAA